MFILNDLQQVALSFSAKSLAGNEAIIENVQVTSSSPEIVQVLSVGNNSFTVLAVGPVGTAQLMATADARIGEGETLITGTEDISVVASEAAIISFSFGAPTPKV